MLRSLGCLGVLLLACSCSANPGSTPGGAGDAGAAGAPETETSADLGVPGGSDGLTFVPLEDGAVLKLQTFGQGGVHVLVGVRCSGFGNRAFVSGSLTDPQTSKETEEPEPARPQLLYCEQGLCDLVPYLVHATGLTPTFAEMDGLEVTLSANVRSETGAHADASRTIVLSTADL
jgi:hypothetical protein